MENHNSVPNSHAFEIPDLLAFRISCQLGFSTRFSACILLNTVINDQI